VSAICTPSAGRGITRPCVKGLDRRRLLPDQRSFPERSTTRSALQEALFHSHEGTPLRSNPSAAVNRLRRHARQEAYAIN